jgi:hypothetical protein
LAEPIRPLKPGSAHGDPACCSGDAKDGHYQADKRSPPRFEKAFPERLDTIAREKEIVDRCATGPFASRFARAALQTDDKLSKLRSTAGAGDGCLRSAQSPL